MSIMLMALDSMAPCSGSQTLAKYQNYLEGLFKQIPGPHPQGLI